MDPSSRDSFSNTLAASNPISTSTFRVPSVSEDEDDDDNYDYSLGPAPDSDSAIDYSDEGWEEDDVTPSEINHTRLPAASESMSHTHKADNGTTVTIIDADDESDDDDEEVSAVASGPAHPTARGGEEKARDKTSEEFSQEFESDYSPKQSVDQTYPPEAESTTAAHKFPQFFTTHEFKSDSKMPYNLLPPIESTTNSRMSYGFLPPIGSLNSRLVGPNPLYMGPDVQPPDDFSHGVVGPNPLYMDPADWHSYEPLRHGVPSNGPEWIRNMASEDQTDVADCDHSHSETNRMVSDVGPSTVSTKDASTSIAEEMSSPEACGSPVTTQKSEECKKRKRAELDEDEDESDVMGVEIEAVTDDENADAGVLVDNNEQKRGDSACPMPEEQQVAETGRQSRVVKLALSRPIKKARRNSSIGSLALTAAVGAFGGCVATVGFLWSPLAERMLA